MEIYIVFISGTVVIGNLRHFVPLQKRKDPIIRRRWKAVVAWYMLTGFMCLQIVVILMLLENFSREKQWMVALAIPFSKLIFDFVHEKIITKAALPENLREGKFMVLISNNLAYSIGISIALTNATKTTEFLLLGINFCFNMLSCVKAIKFDRKVSPSELETKERNCMTEQVIEELILNETIEMIVPLAFIGSFVIAYYGPNKNILGNIGCAIWKFKKVEDLTPLIAVAEMALLDTGSAILAGGLLWMFCRINIFHEYCKTIKKYWVHVAFHGGSFLSMVSTLYIRLQICYC